MPPKPKFSKEFITKKAYKIVVSEGLNGLTARNLGNKLGSSARPIFTVFENMDDVKKEVRKKSIVKFKEYLSGCERLKDLGVMTVKYANTSPELFKLIFTLGDSEEQNGFNNLDGIEDIYTQAIIEEYKLTQSEAKKVFEQIFITIYGLATLTTGKMREFNEREIHEKISQVISSISLLAKASAKPIKIKKESFVETIERVEREPIVKSKPIKRPEKEKIFSWLD